MRSPSRTPSLGVKVRRASLSTAALVVAIATGFAGCFMMLLAFVNISLYSQAVFVEPNGMVLHLELAVFAAGVVANLIVALGGTRSSARSVESASSPALET